MALCEKLLNKCIAADCANPPFTGLEAKAWLFNKAQVESLTYDQTKPNLATAINMKEISEGVNAVGYTVTALGRTPFTGTNTGFNSSDMMNTTTETFQFLVPDNGADTAETLDNLMGGKIIAVIENSFHGSDGTAQFQVLGAKKALQMSDLSRDPYAEDNAGGWVVTMTAEQTPNSAIFIEHKTGANVDTANYLDSLVSCE